MTNYFILVEEWNYPTESGRELRTEIFDESEKQMALDLAKDICEAELDNFFENTRCDPLGPDHCIGEPFEGYILSDKKGLEPFYYAVRLVEINPLCRK